MGLFAVAYGVVRASLLFVVIASFFSLHLPDANFAAALVLLAIASVSFIGIGMMTAVLPLISPEKGTQLGFIAQGLMLVVSGVYYPVSVLPEWMQWIAKFSPATYALRGIRAAILDGTPAQWADIVAAAPHRRRLGAARAVHVPNRRALREAARKAEAVGMIRTAKTRADFALCAEINNAVDPDQPVTLDLIVTAPGASSFTTAATRTWSSRASPASAFAMVRVRPESRAARSRRPPCLRRPARTRRSFGCRGRCAAASAKATRRRLRFTAYRRLRGSRTGTSACSAAIAAGASRPR